MQTPHVQDDEPDANLHGLEKVSGFHSLFGRILYGQSLSARSISSTAMPRSKSETDLMNASESRHPTDHTLHAHALGVLDVAAAESMSNHLL